MQIVVAANDEQWTALSSERSGLDWVRVGSSHDFLNYPEARAFFMLTEPMHPEELQSLSKPVFVNSVTKTLIALGSPANVYRINGWPGFLGNPVWEIAGPVHEGTTEILNSLNIRTHVVNDEPGFISARVISMIINEAYFALEENVSSKPEIDIAMKLGTNYPFGPFEWAEKIGKQHIVTLLNELYKTDARYKPAGLLAKEAEEN